MQKKPVNSVTMATASDAIKVVSVLEWVKENMSKKKVKCIFNVILWHEARSVTISARLLTS